MSDVLRLEGISKTYGKGAKFKAIEPAPGSYVKQKS